MKLTASRPVTIYTWQHGQAWFPQLHRHTDGTLLIYYEKGYDRNFAPFGRLRSIDNGRTWFDEKENVPRANWAYSFPNGELFEMDWYGVVDPKNPQVAWHYGAWSFPGKPGSDVKRDLVRVHSPHSVNYSSRALTHPYPSFPWWDLINRVHGKSEVTADELNWNMMIYFRVLEHQGDLLALAAGLHRNQGEPGKSPNTERVSLFCFESRDRGRSWTERGLVGLGPKHFPEGFSEGTMVELKDGRLYCVIRTGGPFQHSWSSDGGRTWTPPEPFKLIDSPDMHVGMCWPFLRVGADGTLVMAWGRPRKYMAFDPTGTGRSWQGVLDLHALELDTQAMMGVPEAERLRGETQRGLRHGDSGDMLSFVEIEPRTFFVIYDVQSYRESWNANELDCAIRAVRVKLE